MANKDKTKDALPNLNLAPINTPQGAMERAFLAEALSPDIAGYDPKIDLEAMRDMRQVVENRLKAPSQYMARGVTDAIGIFKAPKQFPELSAYPSGIPNYVDEMVSYANDPTNHKQAIYWQHVQNAITAATESINPPVADLPNATGWKQTPKNGEPASLGSNFYPLRDVGGNTFFATKPQHQQTIPSHGPSQKADNLEGQTYLEKLRSYKAQALAEAAQKPASFHQILMKTLRVQHSYAPIRKRQSGQAKPGKQADAAPWSIAELANTPHMRLMNFLQQNPHPAATLMASIARSAAASPGLALAGFVRNMASDTSAAHNIPPAVFYEYAKNNPWARAAATNPAAGLAKAALRPALPSIAPRMSSPSGYARQRGGAPAEFELASMPNGPAMQQAGGFAPRGHSSAATASGAQVADVSVASAALTQRQVKRALTDYFNAQARLPPSGATGFDRRLTPAWAGQKIPG